MMKVIPLLITIVASVLAAEDTPCRVHDNQECRGPEKDFYVDFTDGKRYCCDKQTYGDTTEVDGKCFCTGEPEDYSDYYEQDGAEEDDLDLDGSFDIDGVVADKPSSGTDKVPDPTPADDKPTKECSEPTQGDCLENEDCRDVSNSNTLRLVDSYGVLCCNSSAYTALTFINQKCVCLKGEESPDNTEECYSPTDGDCLRDAACEDLPHLRKIRLTDSYRKYCCNSNIYTGLSFENQKCKCFKSEADSPRPEDADPNKPEGDKDDKATGSGRQDEGACLKDDACENFHYLTRLRLAGSYGIRCCDSNVYTGLKLENQTCKCYQSDADPGPAPKDKSHDAGGVGKVPDSGALPKEHDDCLDNADCRNVPHLTRLRVTDSDGVHCCDSNVHIGLVFRNKRCKCLKLKSGGSTGN